MIINGLNKLTLLDYPNRTACTVFLAGCNFRCPFCHNAGLVLNAEDCEKIQEEEFFAFLKKRRGILDGVCITGGEPTLRADLPEFIGKIKDMGYLVKLDTNGTNPKMLKRLVDEKKVDYVAMDIKNSLENYSKCVGIENYNTDSIVESISILKNGEVDYEFRTTVDAERITEEDILKIAELLKGDSKYYLQQFKNSGDIILSGKEYGNGEMCSLKEKILPLLPNAEVRGI